MLSTPKFFEYLEEKGVEFSTGVPDSLLKDFCAYVADNGNDIIAANEGASLGLAAGYHLATNKIPMVYMQNSGFGNIINPLTSLVDPEVYSIPMLIMIGWRGEPNVKDEPQHVKQGRVNEDLLKALEQPYEILSSDQGEAEDQVNKAFKYMEENSAPFALLVRKGTFDPYKLKNNPKHDYPLNREGAIKVIIDAIDERDIVVSTTGKTSREVFEHRVSRGHSHDKDFLTVGCMGHASQIALGIALQKKDRQVFCLDGDGAFLMHMGSAAIIGDLKPANFKHIIINNGAHDSVGGQPTVGFRVDFLKIGEACGYTKVLSACTPEEIKNAMEVLGATEGPVMLEIKTTKGARADLGRPTIKPADNKKDFMKNLAD